MGKRLSSAGGQTVSCADFGRLSTRILRYCEQGIERPSGTWTFVYRVCHQQVRTDSWFCIVMRYNYENGFWPPWMRNNRSHGYLRPHDFLFSPDAGSVFGPTRTGYRTAGCTRRGSFAARHNAGWLKLSGRPPDCGARGFGANLAFKGRIPVI